VAYPYMGTTRHFHVVFDVRVLDLNLSIIYPQKRLSLFLPLTHQLTYIKFPHSRYPFPTHYLPTEAAFSLSSPHPPTYIYQIPPTHLAAGSPHLTYTPQKRFSLLLPPLRQ
jgi:hypothetical protein